MKTRILSVAAWMILAGLCTSNAAAAPLLAPEEGDRICIIGGGLADRMQHSGHLETLLHLRFPDHRLAFRNLGFAGDEVKTRMRSEGFGSPDEWLAMEQADIILAFFGYNESHAGREGLEDFRKELDAFIRHTLGQNYNGEGAPTLILFSPTAAEKHSNPNYPDPAPLNRNISLYAKAMGEVAAAHGVPVIDLVKASTAAYRAASGAASGSLTINGVHLSDEGYRAIAPAMYQALLDEEAPPMNAAYEKLREAVAEKNRHWFARYRTVDGYNVYGGRSHLEFDGIKNRDTMQREMQIRDVMTDNRDARIHALVQGRDMQVEDGNLPEPVTVETNKPGDGPGGAHTFLGGEEAIAKMTYPPGCNVELFASEEQFPALANPVQMAFDVKGRLWVAVWPSYPERTPGSRTGDSLLIFEDTDNNGRADKVTPFIEDLNCPTGFQFFDDGVILVQAPDVWFIRDTDGDDRADEMERVLNGLDSADSHHTANALVLDPGGAIYLSDGVFHRTQMETPWGPPVRNNDGAIYRYEHRTGKIERYISYGFANPHGRVFDRWGNDLVTDATGNNTYFGPAFSGNLDFPAKHKSLRQFWERPSRPCPGTAILSTRHFPPEFQDNFLNINVIGFQGIFRVNVREEGSGLWGDTLEPHMIQSSDPNFRPIAADVAPDGSLYFLDWHNPIIGHMQHHLRDPNRDHAHGRIYRVTYEGRPLLKPAKIAGAPIPKLLDLLTEPENNVRTRAKLELGTRKPADVVVAVEKWSKKFDPKKIEDQHALTEALWVHQWINVPDQKILERQLASPEPRARAAAVRVLGYWRDRVLNPLRLLKVAANDESPRVRLEAVRVASFFEGEGAMEVAHEILKYPTDYYLDYTFDETIRQLRNSVKGTYLPKDDRALSGLVRRLNDAELADAPDREAVLRERAVRPGQNINVRTASLAALAGMHKSDFTAEAVAALASLAADSRSEAARDLGFLLASGDPKELKKHTAAFEKLTTGAEQSAVREAAWAAIVAAGESPEAAGARTKDRASARTDLLGSVALHPDAGFRAGFEPVVSEVLNHPETGTADGRAARRAALAALPLLGPDHAEKAFGILARNIVEGTEAELCARTMLQISRDAWSADAASEACDAIVSEAKKVNAKQRTEDRFLTLTQAAREIASVLPESERRSISRELDALAVPVFLIRTVREQMRYDVTKLTVRAGQDFEIILENTDMMPHNVVVVAPGARARVGALADKMDPTPDHRGRAFIPDDPGVLAATKLVEPGRRETLKMKAPDTPGDYDYVCTFPEHWQMMWGVLEVVSAEGEPLTEAEKGVSRLVKDLFGE